MDVDQRAPIHMALLMLVSSSPSLGLSVDEI